MEENRSRPVLQRTCKQWNSRVSQEQSGGQKNIRCPVSVAKTRDVSGSIMFLLKKMSLCKHTFKCKPNF